MSDKTLFVINPNSSETVTSGIDEAMAPLRPLGVPIKVLRLAEGPPGIESQSQADQVIAPLLATAGRLANQAAGFVIACFGDPGLHALRDETTLPVLGIQESAVMTALTMGQRFGVISILPASVPRHLRAFAAMGVMDRLAGDVALGLTVAELADRERTVARMIEIGRELRQRQSADVLIMGCASMAPYRQHLETETGVPVVEPCQAAAAIAIGRIRLGWSHIAGTGEWHAG